ncbi:hypothetical protein ACQPW1_37500 [Nocardia sp. CA-128927]|uniref:hypothetical protein n=1 Tax=Nocardia sp. CA-128927 TaxID=3239975 RepID=UPI003D97E668
MRSDCEKVPDGFTKEQADKAEIMEAAAQNKESRTPGGEPRLMVEPGCQVYWPAPYEVCGAIRDKYNELGGPNSFLLWPTTNELTNPDGFGKRSVFQNGPIYWSADSGAHPVANHFFAAWQRNGWEAGPLHYPTSDEIVNPDGIGRRQEFQGGTIYWKLNEAHYVAGAIRDKWGETGWEGGWLGYPITDETGTAVGGGRFNRFERGVIYWSGSSGAHPVTGGVLDKWGKAGYEGGSFGFPTGDQTSRDGNVTVEQQFQGGLITAPGPYAVELARLNPGTTGEQMIAEAQRVAAETSASVIAVLQDVVSGSHQDLPLSAISDPVGGDRQLLPDARVAGDLFFADAATAGVNHGHNGLFVTRVQTMEALDPERGVKLINNPTAEPDGSPRKIYKPKLMSVNTTPEVRALAIDFARNQEGKAYNSNFAFNKGKIWDDRYNCSQLLWAAYRAASVSPKVDLDEAADDPTEHTPTAIFPREILKSKWVTPYP